MTILWYFRDKIRFYNINTITECNGGQLILGYNGTDAICCCCGGILFNVWTAELWCHWDQHWSHLIVRRQLYFVEYIFGWCCLDDDDDVSQFEKYIIHKSWCLPSKMKHKHKIHQLEWLNKILYSSDLN